MVGPSAPAHTSRCSAGGTLGLEPRPEAECLERSSSMFSPLAGSASAVPGSELRRPHLFAGSGFLLSWAVDARTHVNGGLPPPTVQSLYAFNSSLVQQNLM